MAIVGALSSGNWSSALVFPTPPASNDTVVANGFTVTIDNAPNIGSGTIQTLAAGIYASGGGFTLPSGGSITANVLAGTTTCVTVSAGDSSIIGNLTGSAATSSVRAVAKITSGTLTITGNITGGGASSAFGLFTNSATGTVSITGNILGGSATTGHGLSLTGGNINVTGNITGSLGRGIDIILSPTLTITGTVSGSASSTGIGLQIGGAATVTIHGNISADLSAAVANSAGTLTTDSGNVTGSITATSQSGISITSTGVATITGNVTAGSLTNSYGVSTSSTGALTIVGNILAGTNAFGVNVTSTAVVSVTGNVTSSATSIGISNSSTGLITVNGTVTAAAGGPGVKRTSASAVITTINGGMVGETSVGWPGVIGGQLGKILIGPTTAQTHQYATDSGGGTPSTLRSLTTASGGLMVRRSYGGFQ